MIVEFRKSSHMDNGDMSGSTDSMGKRNVLKRGPKRRKGQYVGVSYHRGAKKWAAYITVKGKLKYLGLHKSKVIAAKVYDTWARRIHGKRADLNFPKEVA